MAFSKSTTKDSLIHLLPPFSHSFTNCGSLGAPAKDGGLEGRIQHPDQSGWNPNWDPAELGTEEFPGS